MKIKVEKDIYKKNKDTASKNRSFFEERGITVINLMASPGAGKTSFILKTLSKLEFPSAVIEGDIASSIDTDTLTSHNIPAIQINTSGGCHLNATMINDVLNKIAYKDCKLIIIENVGNLVCPAPYDLGESLKIVLSSIPEGDDKPYKYPKIFSVADAIIVNKLDLLPYVDFNQNRFFTGVKALNKDAPIFTVSCKTGEGIDDWIDWLLKHLS